MFNISENRETDLNCFKTREASVFWAIYRRFKKNARKLSCYVLLRQINTIHKYCQSWVI